MHDSVEWIRVGRGGAQEWPSPALAGCRLTIRQASMNRARGPTFARYLASLFYFSQDYLLSIDSHSRLSLHWDVKMISRVYQMPTRGVLSHYPLGYTPSSFTDIPTNNNCIRNNSNDSNNSNKNDTQPSTQEGYTDWGAARVMVMCAAVLLPSGIPKLSADWALPSPRLTRQGFAAAGYLFGDAQCMLDVPLDPLIPYLFDGEESLYSARLWTAGWDMYSPMEANILHYYVRPGAPRFGSVLTPKQQKQERYASERRALYLMKRFQPWAATLEELWQAHTRRQSMSNTSTTCTWEAFRLSVPHVPPEQRRYVSDDDALRHWPLAALQSYYGMGTVRSVEDYWRWVELTDELVTRRDEEGRWMGGNGLCRGSKQYDEDVVD